MYPSTITTFSTKANGQVIDASDVNNVQTDVVALENKVGVDNSVIVTSLDYLVKSSSSSGGGHIQAANTGGTGQTSFTKGDLLVASSTSVLSKLGVGSDGLALLADSSQSAGVNWGAVTANLPYALDSGTGSVYAIAPTPAITTYVAGQVFEAKILNTNTISTPALSVSSLIAKAVVYPNQASVLTGHIPSSTIGLFGYDGTNFQFLTGGTVNYKNGTTTHDISVTGAQTIAHGLGVTPKQIKVRVFFSPSASAGYMSDGVYNGITTSCIFQYIAASGQTAGTDSTNIVNLPIPSNAVVATVSYDAINITLTWSKTNTPTGTCVIIWEVMA